MKRAILFFCTLAILFFCFAGCSTTVDKSCDWCGRRPSVAYKNSAGDDAYVCKDCSSECMYCGDEKATKRAENLFGMILFLCSDCYNDAVCN